MKITPFIVLLLLLIVLVLFTLFCKSPFFQREGFITFLKNEDSMTEQIIPQYSDKKVYKLYDNLFFDTKNGSLVEVDGTSDEATDENSKIVENIIVTPRIEQDTYIYKIENEDTEIELPNEILHSSLKSKLYYTQSSHTNKYAVIYVPWDKKTFIHVINVSSSPFAQEGSFLFNEDETPQGKLLQGETLENMDCEEEMDPENNKDVLEPSYNHERTVHQLCKHVKYDLKNGNLLVLNKEMTNIDIYNREDRNKETIQRFESNSTETEGSKKEYGNNTEYKDVSYSVCTINDLGGKNTVLYISKGYETLVIILCKENENEIKIKNIKRFNPNGLYNGAKMGSYEGKELKETLEDNKDKLFASVGGKLGTEVGSMLDELVDGLEEIEDKETGDLSYKDFFKYYMQKEKLKKTVKDDEISADDVLDSNKNNEESQEAESDKFNLNDYILKTQIVPPVCPTCPACSSCTGTCTNCGGSGGSGTLTVDGSSNVVADAVSKVQKIDGSGNALSNVVGATGDIASSAINTTGDIANTTIGATGELLTGTVNTAENVLTGAIDSVGNVASSIVGAGANVINSAGQPSQQTPQQSLQQAPQQSLQQAPQQSLQQAPQQNAMNSNTQMISPSEVDFYSYNGQLPYKGSVNFMPRTADFSSFGK
tara:strand:- start:3121 stop:5079 length:1959 start_codon:yes stop_codon:yes gene_type:complete